MRGPIEKKERALGEKLFLKGERCSSPKCAMIRKPYRPGVHGRNRRVISEYGQQLMEKQKFRVTYGLTENQIKKFFEQALRKKGITGAEMIKMMERRLDNVVFRIGFANSRLTAKQLVSHGHILVNNRKVTTPSYQIRLNDIIKIKESSKGKLKFKELASYLKRYEPPNWLSLDKQKLEGKVVSNPKEIEITFNINSVVEFYSK